MTKHHSISQFNRRFGLTAILILLVWLAAPRPCPAANLVVTSQANTGPGTLRTLLPTARNGDVITFAVTGLITNIAAGGFVISNNLSIVGPGPGVLTITGTNWLRGFVVNSGATSNISGLTFDECYRAIDNSGNIVVSNCVFSNNHGGNGAVSASNGGSGFPAGGGGGIYNSGTLMAVNCEFLNNAGGAGGFGTPVPAYDFYGPNSYTTGGNGASGGSGGAIYDTGTASFLACTFAGNTAGVGGVGGTGNSGSGSYVGGHSLNPGPGGNGGNGGDGGNGGAVYTLGGAKFISCTFFGNTAGAGGGGGPGGDAYNPNGHYAYSGGSGGAAGNAGSGTIYCTGACQIVACTFYNNSAGSGGSGGNGGSGSSDGINGQPGGSGGNSGWGGSGGGIFGPRASGTNFILQNVLIAGDTYGYAGPAGSAGSDGGGRLVGTSGTNGLGAIDGAGPDLSGCFSSRGHNLVGLSDGSTGFTNNVRNDLVGSGPPIDAMVNDLADNGGPVTTCSLQSGSPAVDAGDDTLLGSPWYLTTDARGYARKSGAHVDIGAYELAQLSLPVVARVMMTSDGARLSVTNTPGVTFEVLSTTDLTQPVANWNVLGQMNEVSPGMFQWTDTSSGNYDFQFYLLRSP